MSQSVVKVDNHQRDILRVDGRYGFDDDDLNEMHLDVIKEVSNIIFNALIGEFGNLLNLKLGYTTPDIGIVVISSEEGGVDLPEKINILILHTKFTLANTHISGTILVTLSKNAIALLTNKIDEMLGELI